MRKACRMLTATAVPLGCTYRTCHYHNYHQNMRFCGNPAVSSSLQAIMSNSTAFQQQQVRYFSNRLRPLRTLTSLPSHVTLITSVRTQYAGATDPAAKTEGTVKSATAATKEEVAQTQRGGDVHVDPRRLPSTIPGISQEELAARITAYHTKKSQEASVLSAKALTEEVELMRRSLSPNDFATYMQNLEKGMAAAAKEQAKLAAMSPVQLHQYQQKKKRQAVRYEWYKTFLMVFALVGSTALLFSLFLFFE